LVRRVSVTVVRDGENGKRVRRRACDGDKYVVHNSLRAIVRRAIQRVIQRIRIVILKLLNISIRVGKKLLVGFIRPQLRDERAPAGDALLERQLAMDASQQPL
jgi:hypothetical protein